MLFVICILTLGLSLLTGCGAGDEDVITSLDQLNEPGRIIGVADNTNDDKMVAEKLPRAEIKYHKDAMIGYTEVSQGKLDAFVYGKTAMETAIRNGMSGVHLLDETLGESYTMAVAIAPNSKIPDLENKINLFLDEVKEDGTLDDMIDRWLVKQDKTMPQISVPENSDLHLVVGTTGVYEPYTYYSGIELNGYDIELAYRFAAWLGATIEFKVYDYGGIVDAAQGGDVDCIFAALFVTPEREEAIRFSQPTYVEEIAVMVRDSESTLDSAGESGIESGVGPELTEYSELSGKTVSMLTGAPFEELVKSKAPDVREFTFYNSTPDMIEALKTKKTDAFLMNNAVSQLVLNRNPDLALFPQNLQDGEFGIAFAKGNNRRDEWQAAYDSIPKAKIQKAWDKWTGADDSIKNLPEQDWAGANGTVRVAACDTLEPMSYVGGDGELKGFDLEVILMVARELDVKVEFTGMEFSAILAAVQSGKADMGAGSIIITAERAEAVDFLEYYPAAFVLVVRTVATSQAEAVQNDSIPGKIRDSFNKTFVREDRWKLFVGGIGTTLLITLLTLLFGTILGFAVFMLCRRENPVANRITHFCLWLVQGMPMVVLLMILYYIIFGSFAISGIVVAVIGFTLTFGSAVFGLLRMGVGVIDRGQYEAAYALGYSDYRTFFKVVLPQALPHVFPAYKGEVVGLIKATAIVGYIAVQDLTKMGDIVRSRTYEAFFPLIAVTVFYFVLEGVIGALISRININLNPKRRTPSDILKGVKTDD